MCGTIHVLKVMDELLCELHFLCIDIQYIIGVNHKCIGRYLKFMMIGIIKCYTRGQSKNVPPFTRNQIVANFRFID